jgi:hypothetical protein
VNDYLCIRAWEKMMGSPDCEHKVERAIATAAPHDAIYERWEGGTPTGQWELLRAVTDPHTRAYFEDNYPELLSHSEIS